MSRKRFVYADNAATTCVSDEVLSAMLPYFTENYGNPSSIYTFAHNAKHALDEARDKIADAIGADRKEIYFTSGGTESDNWAITGAARIGEKRDKKHIISTNVEHHAVLHTLNALEKQGFEITFLEVDTEGMLRPEQVAETIREDTALVTVMYANNEVGVVYPISEIGSICRDKKVLFHTDAVQAIGSMPIDVGVQNIDMLSISGHKIHTPKGIGCLYVRKGVVIDNILHGGSQERGKRPGTENVPYAVGLGVAVSSAVKDIERRTAYVKELRDRLAEGITKAIPKVKINGTMENRLCGNLNISFEGIEGESILLGLDMKGVCASSGSACTSGSLDPSHVLLAMGLPHELAHGSLRLSLNELNTPEDVEYILEVLPPVISRLREMSPVWKG